MNLLDARGSPVTGATPVALAAFERALAAFQSWRTGSEADVSAALQEAPEFMMAYVLRAYLAICSRDPRRVRSALPDLLRARALRANARERVHLAVIAAVLGGDYQRARGWLGELLAQHPRDALALQVAHAFDYLTGDSERLVDRIAGVLPAWSRDLPGYHAVLAMHAFGLEETGACGQAEQVAGEALALCPLDARAHHVMAHVFEMTDRADAGVRWLSERMAGWAGAGTTVDVHCWWHIALFHLARGDHGSALAVYDVRVRGRRSAELSDLIDASALLWRIQLRDIEVGGRWLELAGAWAPHIDDRFCSFNDVHAMLAFVGARDWQRARRLEHVLTLSQTRATRHGETTRSLGLPAARALIAFGRGRDALAVSLLQSLPLSALRLGGSHAQRDVLELTHNRALERMRRSTRKSRFGFGSAARPAWPRLLNNAMSTGWAPL
jgi:hypothetical protein